MTCFTAYLLFCSGLEGNPKYLWVVPVLQWCTQYFATCLKMYYPSPWYSKEKPSWVYSLCYSVSEFQTFQVWRGFWASLHFKNPIGRYDVQPGLRTTDLQDLKWRHYGHKYHMVSLICGILRYKWTNLQDRVTNVEKNLWLRGGKGQGGINWEIETDRYILLYKKEITNKISGTLLNTL